MSKRKTLTAVQRDILLRCIGQLEVQAAELAVVQGHGQDGVVVKFVAMTLRSLADLVVHVLAREQGGA